MGDYAGLLLGFFVRMELIDINQPRLDLDPVYRNLSEMPISCEKGSSVLVDRKLLCGIKTIHTFKTPIQLKLNQINSRSCRHRRYLSG